MKRFVLSSLILLTAARPLKAQTIDGFVMPLLFFGYPLTKYEGRPENGSSEARESESRVGIMFEVGRASNYIALDLRIGFRSDYTDFGPMLRFFNTIDSDDRLAVQGGVGLGLSYSRGWPADNPADTAGPNEFVDQIIYPFGRVVSDIKSGVGFVGEAGLEWIPKRTFVGGQGEDYRSRIRVVVGAGAMLDWDAYLEDETVLSRGVFQKTKISEFSWGVRLGLPSTKWRGRDSNGDPESNNTFGRGLALGVVGDFGEGPFGLMVDLGWIRRTFGVKNSDQFFHYNAIELPVRFRVRATNFFFATVGGYGQLAVGDYHSRVLGVSQESQTFERQGLYRFDYGLCGGPGFKLAGQGVAAALEFRLVWGLANLADASDSNTSLKTFGVDSSLVIFF